VIWRLTLVLTLMAERGLSAPLRAQAAPMGAFFDHPATSAWWVSGQANFIFQAHGDFTAPYSGTNSLDPNAEHALSRVLTLFTGYEPVRGTMIYFDVEASGGAGISDALGLAGFTNLDVVRNPSLGTAPYVARLMIQQIIPLSKDTVTVERTPLSLATVLPARRLEIRAGKFSLADFFDLNVGGSDSHYQFMNWLNDNNGAWDYAADTRGYTVGAIVDFEDRDWGVRFAEAAMPIVANGPSLDHDISQARAANLEIELRPTLLTGRESAIRLLAFVNRGNMGDYDAAIRAYQADPSQPPDITATRVPGTIKYGFGVNAEQEVSADLWAFGRWGWNEGQHESFCYTEADGTLQLGLYAKGTRWSRALDRAGVALVSNSISGPHQTYLADGGLGFILGDGALTAGRENIAEGFYTAHAWRGLFFAADIQFIDHPGYNRVRGPVTVPGLRMHLEF